MNFLTNNLILRGRGLMAVLVMLFFSGQRALALDTEKSLDQFNCQSWTRSSGLPDDKINTITQSKDGFMWFGTQNGLVRFDGFEFKAIPVNLSGSKEQEVRSLAASSTGGLWFAIGNGMFGKYDGQQFSRVGDDSWTMSGINANVVLAGRNNVVWGGADLALGRWEEGKPNATTLEQTNNLVISLTEDPSGLLWAGTSEHGLWYWANGQLNPIPDETLKQQNLFAMAAERDGRIWIGTGQGLFVYDPKGLLTKLPLNVEVRSLLVDRHGTLWIGTSGQGLGRYQNGTFTFLKRGDGLVSNYIISLFEDAEGSLWVGTRDGLSELTDLKFPIYSSKEGINDGSVISVTAARKGGLWVTTASGACWFDGKTVRNFTNSPDFGWLYTKMSFEASNGDLYLVDGNKSIDMIRGDTVTAVYTNKSWVTALGEDDQGMLASVGDKLFHIQDGQLKPYLLRSARQPVFYWINNLLTAKDGSVWVASNNGIFRIHDGHFKQWLNERVNCLFEDTNGSMWAGLSDGIARIKDGHATMVRTEDGLGDNRIYAIVADDDGNLWFDSGNGIFRASRAGLNDFADGKQPRVACDNFNGLESVKFTDRIDQQPSGCKTADGRIWFPNPKGVVMIDPRHYFANVVAPQVHIEQIVVDGKELKNRRAPVFHSGDKQMKFSFTALSFIAPKKMQVQYQLTGFDPTWIDAGVRREASYNNLLPGKYIFHVRAGNADGVWNEAGDSFEMVLPPPFYQAAWFRSLCGLLVVGLLLAGYRWKVRLIEHHQRKLQAANDLLEVRVAERTEQLAVVNTSLQQAIEGHKRTEQELKQKTRSLEGEIEERKRMQQELQHENSERKRAEDVVRESQALYYSLVDHLPAGVFRKNARGQYEFVNSCFCRMKGATPEDFLGKTAQEVRLAELASKGGVDAMREQLSDQGTNQHAQIMATGQPIEMEEVFPGANGTLQYFHVVKSAVFGHDGTIVGTQGILLDVTQRKQVEATLAQERDLLRTLMDSSDDSIYFKDIESRFIRCSANMARAFRLPSAAAMAGRLDSDYFSAEHAREALADEQEIIRTGKPLLGKIEKETWPDGRVTWVLTSKMASRNKVGDIVGTFGISKDITAIKNAEEKLAQVHKQLLETSRQAGMAEVATSVLHNVGNVLNSVNVSSSLIADKVRSSKSANVAKVAGLLQAHKNDLAEFLTNDAKGKQLPEYVATLAEHLAAEQKSMLQELDSLVHNIIHIKEIVAMQQNYAKTSGLLESHKITDLVEDALRMNSGALDRHQVKVVKEIADLPPILTDKHKVLQILVNLIRNAKYACDDAYRDDKQITLRVYNGDGRVKIAVGDNGVGIPPENLTRIFNHGFTTRKEGHGFGLHSGALAAKELGGSLSVFSQGTGQGAVFTLELPANGVRAKKG